jgi:hypothetical protein
VLELGVEIAMLAARDRVGGMRLGRPVIGEKRDPIVGGNPGQRHPDATVPAWIADLTKGDDPEGA